MSCAARFARGDEAPAPDGSLTFGADRPNLNGVAAEGPSHTRPFSGEWLQGLRVSPQDVQRVGAHQRESGSPMYANTDAYSRRPLQSRRVLGAAAGTRNHPIEDLFREVCFLRGRSRLLKRIAASFRDTGGRTNAGEQKREPDGNCAAHQNDLDPDSPCVHLIPGAR